MRVVLALCVCDLNTHACNLNTHVCDLNIHACDLNIHAYDLTTLACDFDTLRVKLFYYIKNIDHICLKPQTLKMATGALKKMDSKPN
jgi:hypothetical protein